MTRGRAQDELHDDLLELELRQMEADDQIISEFERRMGDLVNKFTEAAQVCSALGLLCLPRRDAVCDCAAGVGEGGAE